MQVSLSNKISNPQPKTKTNAQTPSNIHFKGHCDISDIKDNKIDAFKPSSELISSIETNKYKGLKSVTFKKPLHISQAVESLLQNDYLAYKLLERLHTHEDLTQFKNDLKNTEHLKNLKVKKLYAIGNFALAFETTDEKILKITKYDHFNGREPAFFDLPIIKQGQSGHTRYYLEKKVSHDNITQEELRAFVREIKAHGYKMKDYLLHYTPGEDEADATIKVEQFGKLNDNKLYLIDPACAEAPPKHFFNPKYIKNKFSHLFNNQK